MEDVLSSCIYIDHCEKIRDQLAQLLEKELKLGITAGDPAFSAAVRSILNDEPELPSELSQTARLYLNDSEKISTGDFKALLNKLGNSVKKAYERFEQQIGSRGDLLLLTRPPLAAHDVRIAWLRRAWQVNTGSLILRNSSYVPNHNLGQHVAQLASPFKYRLTQQFAQVFSDIGTPDISQTWIGVNLKGKWNEN